MTSASTSLSNHFVGSSSSGNGRATSHLQNAEPMNPKRALPEEATNTEQANLASVLLSFSQEQLQADHPTDKGCIVIEDKRYRKNSNGDQEDVLPEEEDSAMSLARLSPTPRSMTLLNVETFVHQPVRHGASLPVLAISPTPSVGDQSGIHNSTFTSTSNTNNNNNIQSAASLATSGPSTVRAYAKLQGKTWEYYVQKLSIFLGRSPDAGASSTGAVDVYLGMHPNISMKHLRIEYNVAEKHWELFCFGKSGVHINGERFEPFCQPILLTSR